MPRKILTKVGSGPIGSGYGVYPAKYASYWEAEAAEAPRVAIARNLRDKYRLRCDGFGSETRKERAQAQTYWSLEAAVAAARGFLRRELAA